MKLYSSILILLLFSLACSGRTECSEKAFCGNNNLICTNILESQPVILQGTFWGEQDSNDIDGPDSFIINPVPSVNPFQYKATPITIVLPFTFQMHMNALFIDLPPPSLS